MSSLVPWGQLRAPQGLLEGGRGSQPPEPPWASPTSCAPGFSLKTISGPAREQTGMGPAIHPRVPHSLLCLNFPYCSFLDGVHLANLKQIWSDWWWLERLCHPELAEGPLFCQPPGGGVPHGLCRGQGPCALPELPGGYVEGGERHPGKNELGKTSQVQIPAGSVTLGQWLPLSDPESPCVERLGPGFQTTSHSVCP